MDPVLIPAPVLHSIMFERMLMSCLEHIIAILSYQERFIKDLEETVVIQRRTLSNLSRHVRRLERERLRATIRE